MKVDWIQRSRDLSPRVRNFLDGRWRECGGPTLIKYSPRDGQALYQFGSGEKCTIDDAVQGAREAFEDGRWSLLPTQDRKQILYKFASLIEEHSDELALLDCLDVGKPISDPLRFDVPAAAGTMRFAAEAADKLHGAVYGADRTSLSYQLHRPLGVVAAIVGWNFPLLLAAQKIGPALATGNCMVLKPSELSPLSAARLAELAYDAGVPPGVLNVIHGGPEVGAALAHHRKVDALTFTGSTSTGKKLLIASGESNMKRLILECGGKAPNIVFDDSPQLEAVAEAIVARAFWNQGQVCTASSRLLVQASIKEELLRLVIEKASYLVPQDPLLEGTSFGALISEGHKQKVRSYIESGRQEGATIAYESRARSPFDGGFYVSPVIYDDVAPNQRIAQEEIFGPVLSVISFRDEEEAISIANATIYGLSAIIWTTSLGRAHRLSQRVNAGWISVNATARPHGGPGDGVVSTGGHKESGLGMEGGVEGLEAFVSKTAVQLFV